MRFLIYHASYHRLQDALAKAAPGVEFVLMDDSGALTLDTRPIALEEAGVEAAWANAEAWFGPAARDYTVAMLKSPGLRWLQSGAAGFDHPMFSQLVQRGVKLTTSHGQAVGMADYVLWGVLDHFQKGAERRAAQAAHRWDRLQFRDIERTRWLVIGFGSIGQGVGQRARAFGAHVTGVRRNQAPHPAADLIAADKDIPGLLPEADVVVLSVPLTPETRHLVDADFLARMKPRSVLVNVGRGGLVDEPALLAALDKGVPEYALLDVFETEPLPAESRFWDHPRVTLTAHASGISEGQALRNDELFVENLRRYAAGEPLLNLADPKDVLAG
ncbi:D-2-hydroxyacid dehydrogenase [Phenylobacterium soli]|uniref:D-2-hydroxyacid dehydrogenase n=1 Tax=Phenylobacterium soli TaxID=2170551 RepID=A0A328AI60_9CAUL|nr:D-2-hydroxyacid dehydrogenase [Phenylobacterium soli]RAK53746.1 D-2-hydroxyacid dehydrogenase [Phenylobacterium soli]